MTVVEELDYLRFFYEESRGYHNGGGEEAEVFVRNKWQRELNNQVPDEYQ